MYLLNKSLLPFNSFQFFISPVHQNNKWIRESWVKCGMCLVISFMLHTHRQAYKQWQMFFFFLSLTLLVIENSVCMLVQRCIIFPGWRQKLKAVWFWWRALAMPLRLLLLQHVETLILRVLLTRPLQTLPTHFSEIWMVEMSDLRVSHSRGCATFSHSLRGTGAHAKKKKTFLFESLR